MLRSAKELLGYKIQALDGRIGSAHDLDFDDVHWAIRYLVVDTGNWLPGRLVLISPSSLKQPDWASSTFPIALTKEQIERSPDVSADKSVSRQHESELHKYYGWPAYWLAYSPPGAVSSPVPPGGETLPPERERGEDRTNGDPHLRSVKEVTGYHIAATDREIGHVEDFILDDETWKLRYMVVDTRNWLPGRKVLIAPPWIKSVRWDEMRVHVDMTAEEVKNSPEFDSSQPVNREYETKLYDYYGRPRYW